MGRKFEIPQRYRGSVTTRIKQLRRAADTRKRDLAPGVLDLGPVRFFLARHFGFCFGVENAIEIAYQALRENPERRVFLLSEMIHNPHVNADLTARGVRFILATDGSQLVPFDELCSDDIVIVPAFGTTVELFQTLSSRGIDPLRYNATCPFVEKVWKRSASLGEQGYTVIIHGKHTHEETRATFSHSRLAAPSLVIRDRAEAELLAEYLGGSRALEGFLDEFGQRCSPDFDPHKHLVRIGVVNQTTMLASETQEIAELLRTAMRRRFGDAQLSEHFADTRDTLCYATNENQEATQALIAAGGDLALVVGGYNSSNTSHLVELCAEKLPTYYIKDAGEILSRDEIRHLDLASHQVITSRQWMPSSDHPISILLTAGASCPDAQVDQVIERVAEFFPERRSVEQALTTFEMSL